MSKVAPSTPDSMDLFDLLTAARTQLAGLDLDERLDPKIYTVVDEIQVLMEEAREGLGAWVPAVRVM